MATNEERIAELERQIAQLKEMNANGKRRQIAEQIISKYGIDSDDILLEHTLDHLGINEATDVATIIGTAEESFKANCKRAGVQLDSVTEFENYIKDRQKQIEQENKDAEELRKIMI